MRIGIIGRHPQILRGAEATAASLGHQVSGTTGDEQALEWIRTGVIDALVIGGGVESDSRATLLAACADRGVKPIEVFGPDSLRETLAALT